MLRAWLGEDGPPWPDEEQSRRRHFEEGQFEEARAEWPANWRPECDALQQLATGDNAKRVVHYVPRDIRRIWTDSAQSAIFNDVLDQRLASGTASVVGEDDISWKYDRFYEAIDVPIGEPVPTGPLWGKRMRRATGVVDMCECEALERAGLSMQCFDGRRGPEGARRPLVVPIVSPRCEAGFDEHGREKGWLERREERGIIAIRIRGGTGIAMRHRRKKRSLGEAPGISRTTGEKGGGEKRNT